jgi:hypothetical protein
MGGPPRRRKPSSERYPIEIIKDDPAWVLAEAKVFLSSDPVLHNLILTLLHSSVAHREPGRYWLADRGLWLWDDGKPGAMAVVGEPVENVVSSQYVYTPAIPNPFSEFVNIRTPIFYFGTATK